MNDIFNQIKNLNLQDYISIIFIVVGILNIIANDKQKEYILSNDKKYDNLSQKIYILILIITICIYIYFINGNYQAYNNCDDNQKEIFFIRLFGSIFFLVGGICFLYFRLNDKNNIQSIVEI